MLHPLLSSPAPRLLAASVALMLSLVSAQAFAQSGGSVRYSYEKVEVAGSQQWVLVPRAELKLSLRGKAPSKGDVISAFNLLKKKKSTSYGAAKIKITPGKWPSKARVQITIDPKYSRYSPIVMAEVVYTLTEMGLPGVEFPGYADGLVAREDIPFSVYTLTVPMWQALPPNNVSPAQVTLSTGETLTSSEFYARWKKKDAALIKDLYAFLESPNSSTAIFVMRRLPELKLKGYVKKVTPLLKHTRAVVRTEALKVLANERNDAGVLAAVAARLDEEKDAKVAAQAAAFLGKAKDKKYAVLEPIWQLGNAEPKVAVAAASALTKFKKDERVVPALYKQLSTKREGVAAASAAALASLDADDAQLKALKDDKIATALQLDIARDLGEDSDAAAKVAGLSFLGANAPEREAMRAIASLAKTKDAAARAAAEAFLTDKIAWRREAAAEALAARKDPASLPAFAEAIKAGEGARALEEAGYAIMVAQPLDEILALTKDKNNIVQRLAYRAVGERALKEKAGKDVFETLVAGTKNRDPLIRGASARALGAFANKEAADVLGGLVKDRSADVRRDVALALGNFKGGEMTDALVAYLDDKSPQVVAAAAESLGARGEALAWDKLKALTKSREPEVRASAMGALSALTNRDDKAVVTEIISMLSGAVNDSSMIVRERALLELGTFKDENAVFSIATQLQAKELPLRIAAIRALGKTGHPAAKDLITGVLDDPSVKVRRAAVEALADLGDKSARANIEAQLKQEKDAELQGLMRATLKKL